MGTPWIGLKSIFFLSKKPVSCRIICNPSQQEGLCLHPTHAFPISLHPRRTALHKTSHHPSLKPIQLRKFCKLCRKSFKTLQDLVAHEQIFHFQTPNSVTCGFCEGVFSSRILAKKHEFCCTKKPQEEFLEETMESFDSKELFCFICDQKVENKG